MFQIKWVVIISAYYIYIIYFHFAWKIVPISIYDFKRFMIRTSNDINAVLRKDVDEYLRIQGIKQIPSLLSSDVIRLENLNT